MLKGRNGKCLALLGCLLLLTLQNRFVHAFELDDAVQMALQNAPEIIGIQATQAKLYEASIFESQISDPVFTFGVMNLPVDSFDFGQEPMSQIQFGIQQTFPKGKSLVYAKKEKQNLAKAATYQEALIRLEIVRNVRLAWLDLVYWLRVAEQTRIQKHIFQDALSVTESMLANDNALQYELVQAQLELNNVEIQLAEVVNNIKSAQANLSRWIDKRYVAEIESTSYPKLPPIITYKQLRAGLVNHPVLEADSAKIAAAKNNVNKACEQYKPGVTTGLSYGIRQGRNTNGLKRADFVSANVKVDLPILRANRQTKGVRVSQSQMGEAHAQKDIHYKNMLQLLDEQYAKWELYETHVALYDNKITSQSKAYSDAALLAYKNGTSNFTILALSQVRELENRIAAIRSRVERDKALVHLLYLAGETHA